MLSSQPSNTSDQNPDEQFPLSSLPLRTGHSAVFTNSKIYLFGGYIKNPDLQSSRALLYTNDLIEIDILSRSWKNITNNDQSGPSARNGHSLCLRNQDEMILFGGKSNGFHKDIWTYSFNHNLWTLLEDTNQDMNDDHGEMIQKESISPRYGQSAVIYNDELFVFGGYDNNSFVSNQLFKLNLNSLEWKIVKIESNCKIEQRYHHASVLDKKTGEWYIHGGKTATSIVNDTIKISLYSLIENENNVKCQAEVIVSNLSDHFARYGHSMVMEGNKLYSIGGCNQIQDFTDCAYLDLENIKQGWKIQTNHVLSSIFTERKDVAQSVLHSLIQFQNINDSLPAYLLIGGHFQFTTVFNNVNNNSFHCKLFQAKLNDDIFRHVLLFLTMDDLMNLQLVSKSLRICKLTIEDLFWKDYYFNKIRELKQSTIQHFSVRVSPQYLHNIRLDKFKEFQNKKSDYKKNLIKFTRSIVSTMLNNDIERIKQIESFKERNDGTEYYPKDEILKYPTILPQEYNLFKVVQVGNGAVGKTSLFMRMLDGKFPNEDEYTPTVIDSYPTTITVNSNTYRVALFDTAGPEEYDRLRPLSYPDTDVFLLTFTCSDPSSFFNVEFKWLPEIRHHCPDTPIILVSSKIDMRSNYKYIIKKETMPITFKEGELMAKKMGCATYIETSAKKGYGVNELAEIMLKTGSIYKDKEYQSTSKKKCLVQ